MLPVLITIDTEYSLGLFQQGPGRDQAFNFARSIACHGKQGDTGIFYQMDRFDRNALKGVFFVDPMPALIWGQQAVDAIVHPILERGHGVQLHIHTEWLEFAGRQAPVGRTGRNMADFTLEEQRALLNYGIDRLVEAGAPRPVAFRAGNYGANDDTLRALASLGLIYDSSLPPGIAKSDCRISLPSDQIAPIQHHGVIEVPIGAIAGAGKSLRHAQITALSNWELRRAISHAAVAGWPSFVIVSHSFELFDRSKGIQNWLVRRRFDRFCDWLGTKQNARTTTFRKLIEKSADLHASSRCGNKLSVLPHNPVSTFHRMVEQFVINKLHGWNRSSAFILYISAAL